MRALWLAAVVLLTGGCAAPVTPPMGLIFTRVTAPITTDFHGTPTGKGTKSYTVTQNYMIREPFVTNMSAAWSDDRLREIASQGGFTRMQYAEYTYSSVLGVFSAMDITVYGDDGKAEPTAAVSVPATNASPADPVK